MFGKNTEAVDFKWPSAADLLKMPTNQPIKALKIRWKPNSSQSNFIGGVQLVFSNGHYSPVFLCKKQEDSDMRESIITSNIRKLRGTTNSSTYYVR